MLGEEHHFIHAEVVLHLTTIMLRNFLVPTCGTKSIPPQPQQRHALPLSPGVFIAPASPLRGKKSSGLAASRTPPDFASLVFQFLPRIVYCGRDFLSVVFFFSWKDDRQEACPSYVHFYICPCGLHLYLPAANSMPISSFLGVSCHRLRRRSAT